MDNKAIVKFCKEVGCCDICCLRYLGLKNPATYENYKEYILKYTESGVEVENNSEEQQITSNSVDNINGNTDVNGCDDEPPKKKKKISICVSCLGILQEENWSECFNMVKETLEKKRYECSTFACALSAPIATLLRDKAIILHLSDAFKDYKEDTLTPLKEAWKWTFGVKLAEQIGMTLDSGAISPLLITLNMEYPDEPQELEILKKLSPSLFQERQKQRRRFTVEFTRPSVEQAMDKISLEQLKGVDKWNKIPSVDIEAKCVSAMCVHAPSYLGGRYIKLSRELPQTPWLIKGKRMMESSVQEIIFEPIAKVFDLTPEDVDHRLKFMSAGREDVDVRCLGDGRPFAIEITDPRRDLTGDELKRVCEEISKGGQVIVQKLMHVSRNELSELKKGEETKCKTYEALCIKLGNENAEPNILNGKTPVAVTEEDIQRINEYRNTEAGDEARIVVKQRTPIRVLHRRPLLTRTRRIYDVVARRVPDYPQLFTLTIRTEAGTYVKEWCHGEFGRTTPSLRDAAGFRADILALDVTAVLLDWPRPQ